MPDYDTSSWASLEDDFHVHIQSTDAKAVADAADALARLLCFSPDEAASLRPEPVAEAVTAALRRHKDKDVQFNGCTALHDLCQHFSELPAKLRRDTTVLRTVRAAAAVDQTLERECHWYRELCEWLAPSGYVADQSGATSPHQKGYPSADSSASPPSASSRDQGRRKKSFFSWSSRQKTDTRVVQEFDASREQKTSTAIEFDGSSWEALEPDFNEHIQSAEANTAREAASALCRLLLGKPTEALRELKPRVNAEAVTAALRRHPTDGLVQWHGCRTLQLLCKRFPELRGQLQCDPTVLTTVQAAPGAVCSRPPGAVRLEKCNWYHELCGWLQSQPKDRHQSGYVADQSGATSPHSATGATSPHSATSATSPHSATSATSPHQPAKEAAASKAEKSVQLEPGHGARLAMFSARFNEKNKDTENKFRAVKKLLLESHYEVLMVDAGGGESFGKLTAKYLRRLDREKGIMLAVCTSDYGEMTESPYSSYAELRYAQEYNLDVLPLQVEDHWKPNPPCGEGHLDTEELALAYISMVFYPSRVRLDCRNKSTEEIACEIAAVLRKGTPP
eukprot:symbB.v1.2.002847.t1/scaffold144.1/size299099/25